MKIINCLGGQPGAAVERKVAEGHARPPAGAGHRVPHIYILYIYIYIYLFIYMYRDIYIYRERDRYRYRYR